VACGLRHRTRATGDGSALYRYGGPPPAKPFRGNVTRCSDCCFEDRRNGLSKRPSTASVHPVGIGSNISLVCSPALHGRIAPTKTSSSSLRPADRDVPGELRAAADVAGRKRQEICSEMRFDALVSVQYSNRSCNRKTVRQALCWPSSHRSAERGAAFG
jgi:hypothetical protein